MKSRLIVQNLIPRHRIVLFPGAIIFTGLYRVMLSSSPRSVPRSRRCSCSTQKESQPSTRRAHGSPRFVRKFALSMAQSLARRFLCSHSALRLCTQKWYVRVTCAQVWTVVDKHQRAEMTSVIHGKYAHEEVSNAELYLVTVSACCISLHTLCLPVSHTWCLHAFTLVHVHLNACLTSCTSPSLLA